MKACDFLVIGAGIAGATAAYELGAHGRVLLLECEQATRLDRPRDRLGSALIRQGGPGP